MVEVTSMQIAVFIALQTGFFVWGFRTAISIIQTSILDLDARIAEVLKGIVEGGIGDFEPPNPLVTLLTQAIAKNMGSESSGAVKEITKDKLGRFK